MSRMTLLYSIQRQQYDVERYVKLTGHRALRRYICASIERTVRGNPRNAQCNMIIIEVSAAVGAFFINNVMGVPHVHTFISPATKTGTDHEIDVAIVCVLKCE